MSSLHEILVEPSQAPANARESPPWDLTGFDDPNNDEEEEGEEGETVVDEATGKKRASRRFFSAEEDELIIDELLEASKSSTAQGGFKPGVYADITAKLRTKARASNRPLPDRAQVKNRIGRLKNDFWSPINFLVTRSGWDWDENDHRVLQFDAQCWDAAIKSNPKCKQWRTRSWPLYLKADTLFAGSKATGESVVDPALPRQAPKRGKKRPSQPADLDDDSQYQNIDWSVFNSIPGILTPGLDSSGSATDESSLASAPRRRPPPPPTPTPASKKDLLATLDALTQTISKFTDETRSVTDESDRGGVITSRRALLNEVADAEWLERDEKVKLLRVVSKMEIDVVEFLLSMTDEEVKHQFIRTYLE